jgi:hypothetical protein
MTLLLILALVVLLAALAPVLGVDSRELDRSEGPRRDKLWAREP